MYYDTKRNLNKSETLLASLTSYPKITSYSDMPGHSGYKDKTGSNQQMIDNQRSVVTSLKDALIIRERLYNDAYLSIENIKKDYDLTNRKTKEKNMVYLFFYRNTQLISLPFEDIAEKLEVTPEYLKKLNKELTSEIFKVKRSLIDLLQNKEKNVFEIT